MALQSRYILCPIVMLSILKPDILPCGGLNLSATRGRAEQIYGFYPREPSPIPSVNKYDDDGWLCKSQESRNASLKTQILKR